MAKRYVIVVEKIEGDHFLLNAATMQQLGIKELDQITVTSPTSFVVLPVKAGAVEPDQLEVPRKITGLSVGDRVLIEPATATQSAATPGASPANARTQSHGPNDVRWDPISDTAFGEVVGMENLKGRIEEALYYLTHPEWFLIRKSLPPRVFLLFGPYGCGKTMLAKAMAGRLISGSDQGLNLDVKLKVLKATEVKDPYLGMSARNVMTYLDAAREAANKGSTVLLVLDEIDSLVGNRADGSTHEEYRDIVNTFLQEVQGARDLDSEIRLKNLQKDPEVIAMRKELAGAVRQQGKKDQQGDIMLSSKEMSPEIKQKLLKLRAKIQAAGGVSTVIIVGTTNDPCRIDEGFISRAGDNVFFVPRPPAKAIEQMLATQLDSAFVDLQDAERKLLAEQAFHAHLTGRDIMLSWLAPLRSMAPGNLTIMGQRSIHSHMPHPTVDIEWEIDLYQRLMQHGHLLLAAQVEEYLKSVQREQPVKERAAA